MTAYIKTGILTKALLSPRIKIYPDEFLEVERQADALEKQLDDIRAIGLGFPADQDRLDAIRTLRKDLAALDRKSRAILMRDNPEWFNYWGV